MNARYCPCFSVNVATICWLSARRCDPLGFTLEDTSMNVRYRVKLEESERQELQGLMAGGTRSVRKVKRAQILLAADYGNSDEQIASTVRVGTSTVYQTKPRFVAEGLKHPLTEHPPPRRHRQLCTN